MKKKLAYFSLGLWTVSTAFSGVLAANVEIFEIRKEIPLQNNKNPQKDYYIDAGKEVGLKEGMVLTVMRSQPVHNPRTNKSQGELKLPVARLKIILVQDKLSVAREHSRIDSKQRPLLQFEGIMVGDKIDLGSARSPNASQMESEEKPSPKARSSALPSLRPMRSQLPAGSPLHGSNVEPVSVPTVR